MGSLVGGGVFSLFDLRVGLPGRVAFNAGSANGSSCWASRCKLVLFGDSGACCLGVLLDEPMVGSSFMALEKTSGKSKAPGGILFLLGLPCGVCDGDMKAFCAVDADIGVSGRCPKSLPVRA